MTSKELEPAICAEVNRFFDRPRMRFPDLLLATGHARLLRKSITVAKLHCEATMDISTKTLPNFHTPDETATGAVTTHARSVIVLPELLGEEIVAQMEAGDKNAERHCSDLSRSPAYEVIKMANGESEEVRSNSQTRDRRRREKARVREPRTHSFSIK